MGTVADAYETLRERAQAVHAAWERPARPRIDVAIDTSSLAAGAEALREALEREAAARGAAIDFGQVAGVGMQWLQPLVEIAWPDGARVLYGPVRPQDAGAIVEEATGQAAGQPGAAGAAAALAIGTLSGERAGLGAWPITRSSRRRPSGGCWRASG